MPFILPVLLLAVLRYLWVRLRWSFPARFRLPGAALYLAFIGSTFLSRLSPWEGLAKALFALGGFFLVFLGNWLCVCLFGDLFLGLRRLCAHQSRRHSHATRLRWFPRLSAATLLLTLSFYALGVPHQREFVVQTHTLHPVSSPARPLRLIYFSDLHLDPLFSYAKLEALTDTLKALQPDAVLFGGDLADMPVSQLDGNGYGSLIRRITPPLGFFAVSGNHEAYMKPAGSTLQWLKEQGVTVLLDSTVCTPLFCITGRLDHQYASHLDIKRRPLSLLSPDVADRPWIVLDHQPKGLDSLDRLSPRRPDLGLSGHTHDGQFFPWNFVIHGIWDLPYGLGERQGTPWITSSGLGQWGPPIRVGTDAEILLLNLE